MKLKDTLSKKVLLTFAFLTITTVASLAAIQVFTVYPAFTSLEQQQAERDMERLLFALEKEMQRLIAINYEYSDWDASYDFMMAMTGNTVPSETARYIEDDLDTEYFTDIGVDAVFMLDRRGNIVWESLHHPGLGQLAVAGQLLTPLNEAHPLITDNADAAAQGVLNTRSDSLMLTARPIVSADMPEVAGTMIIGRYLGEDFLAELGRQVGVDVSLVSFAHSRQLQPEMPATEWLDLSGNIERPATDLLAGERDLRTSMREVLLGTQQVEAGELRLSAQPGLRASKSRSLRTLVRFNDVYGEPGIALRVSTPRNISALGINAMRLTTLGMLTAVLIIGIVFLVLMRRMIVTPVGRLSDHMLEMRSSGDLTMRLDLQNNDEIGKLSEEFDKLAERLWSTQQELEATRDEALDLAQAKSDFLATMSHEIRTPMNGVLGMTQLLEQTRLDSDQLDLVKTIKSSGDLLLSVINDILDFSKLEAGKMELDSQPFNLRSLLEDLLLLLSPQAHAKRLELILSYPNDDMDQFHGDANRIRQILVNLIGNAIKFTERGEVVIIVDASAKAGAAQNNVRIEVADTGIGISPEQQQSIFEAFSQADSSAARRYQGTGLGLAISSRLLDLMEGSISLESEPGKGSRFSVRLPLATAVPRTTEASPSISERRLNVLLAEDNVVSQKIALHVLNELGCDVQLAQDGKEVVSMADGSHDLILMDLYMPGLDGFEAAAEIREREPAGHHVPIIAFTADANADERQRCFEMGMDDFLRKPAKTEQLVALLDRCRRQDFAPNRLDAAGEARRQSSQSV